MIRNSISKVKNNPLMSVVGGVATYMYVTKKMPNSKIATNPYYLTGVVILGVVASAYLSSYIKTNTKNPIAM